MRKSDAVVREVLCSETGKPMPKIPLWMADVKVKFVSDEARQKHPPAPGLVADLSPSRGIGGLGDLDELKAMDVGEVIEDTEGFDENEDDPDEAGDEEFA